MAMSTTRKVVLIISGIAIALVLVFIVGVAIIVSLLRGSPPSIRDNSVLVLKVSSPLPDYVPEDPIRRLFGGQPQDLRTLLAQFRKAKVDKRISAILLDIDVENTGMAKLEEVRTAIADLVIGPLVAVPPTTISFVRKSSKLSMPAAFETPQI